MVTFAFLGNTLFLTILVSMLSNTFSTIVSNATAEIQFRRAVLTLEGVKSDAIFAYQPPFNILALLILVPLKFLVSPRWFHKIHVASVRLLNLPLLLIIAAAERRLLWPGSSPLAADGKPAAGMGKGRRPHFWEAWRITVHNDIETVFDIPPPDSVIDDITADDDLTAHLIRRQYARHDGPMDGAHGGHHGGHHGGPATPGLRRQHSSSQQVPHGKGSASSQGGGSSGGGYKTPSRRDSIMPFPGLRAELRGLLSESDEVSGITARLEALEEGVGRIEDLLVALARGQGVDVDEVIGGRGSGGDDGDDDNEEAVDEEEEVDVPPGAEAQEEVVEEAEEGAAVERTGTLADLDHTADNVDEGG
jgi:hypothetical protein